MPKSEITLILLPSVLFKAADIMMPFSSTEYRDLVFIYCGRYTRLPPELCMLCLEYAGLCGKGTSCAFFWVYF